MPKMLLSYPLTVEPDQSPMLPIPWKFVHFAVFDDSRMDLIIETDEDRDWMATPVTFNVYRTVGRGRVTIDSGQHIASSTGPDGQCFHLYLTE